MSNIEKKIDEKKLKNDHHDNEGLSQVQAHLEALKDANSVFTI